MKEYKNFNSSKISWFRCGGNIDIFCIVNNLEELNKVLLKYKKYENILPIGNGSNLLIRDKGFKGLAIKFSGEFNNIKIIENDKIVAGCGCSSNAVSLFALKNNLVGCEFLNTIPGTIGGVVKMNAGCFESEIKDILVEIKVLVCGEIKNIKRSDINFSYRSSNLPDNLIILEATFQLKKANNDEMENSKNKIKNMQEHRKNNQIVGATCGSTFKNPLDENGKKINAWKLIDEVNLRGFQIGGAKISEKHCNFIINTGKATASDIEKLINITIKEVKEKFKIELQTEIKII